MERWQNRRTIQGSELERQDAEIRDDMFKVEKMTELQLLVKAT